MSKSFLNTLRVIAGITVVLIVCLSCLLAFGAMIAGGLGGSEKAIYLLYVLIFYISCGVVLFFTNIFVVKPGKLLFLYLNAIYILIFVAYLSLTILLNAK